jgi:hypothetical protein
VVHSALILSLLLRTFFVMVTSGSRNRLAAVELQQEGLGLTDTRCSHSESKVTLSNYCTAFLRDIRVTYAA